VVLAAQHAGFMELFATDPDYMNIFGPGDKPVSELCAFMKGSTDPRCHDERPCSD